MDRLQLPPAGCAQVAVAGLRAGQPFASHDWVAQEVPVALEYNGIAHAVMMATPADLDDFATGFTLTEGIVDQPAQIYGVEHVPSAQGYTLQLEIAAACFARLKDRRRSLAGRTGCGLCGTESLAQAVRTLPPVRHAACFTPQAIAYAAAQLRATQQLLAVTGATHAAAWCEADGTVQLTREDVGRHNALDKLVGALQRGKLPAAQGFILVTSRASFEMVQKAVAADVGLLVAVSGVTALAVDVAEKSGLALVGFARGRNLSVYSQPQRILGVLHHEQ